jgi:hypothetical protein
MLDVVDAAGQQHSLRLVVLFLSESQKSLERTQNTNTNTSNKRIPWYYRCTLHIHDGRDRRCHYAFVCSNSEEQRQNTAAAAAGVPCFVVAGY